MLSHILQLSDFLGQRSLYLITCSGFFFHDVAHLCSVPVWTFHIRSLLQQRDLCFMRKAPLLAFYAVGTEQLLMSFDNIHAYVGKDKELSFASHLFHASHDFTNLFQTSLQPPLPQADAPYPTLLLLVQELFHWPFSKLSQTPSSVLRPPEDIEVRFTKA